MVLADLRTDLGQDLQFQVHADIRDLLEEFLHSHNPLFAVSQLDLIE